MVQAVTVGIYPTVTASSGRVAQESSLTGAVRHAAPVMARDLGAHASQEAAKPAVFLRPAGTTPYLMRYFTKLRARDAHEVGGALEAIVNQAFHRDQEWVHILRACLRLANRRLMGVADRFSTLALEHQSPLVRARALLAWARHAEEDETRPAEQFFSREAQMWRGYAVAAMNGRSQTARAKLHKRWASENQSVRELIEKLDERPIGWSHM